MSTAILRAGRRSDGIGRLLPSGPARHAHRSGDGPAADPQTVRIYRPVLDDTLS
jgi:hypothetical protein